MSRDVRLHKPAADPQYVGPHPKTLRDSKRKYSNETKYSQTSSINCTQSQILNVFGLV